MDALHGGQHDEQRGCKQAGLDDWQWRSIRSQAGLLEGHVRLATDLIHASRLGLSSRDQVRTGRRLWDMRTATRSRNVRAARHVDGLCACSRVLVGRVNSRVSRLAFVVDWALIHRCPKVRRSLHGGGTAWGA